MRRERAGDGAVRGSAAPRALPALLRALGDRDGRGGGRAGTPPLALGGGSRYWSLSPGSVRTVPTAPAHRPPAGRGGKGWGSCPLPQGSCGRGGEVLWGKPGTGLGRGERRWSLLRPRERHRRPLPSFVDCAEGRGGRAPRSPGGRRARPRSWRLLLWTSSSPLIPVFPGCWRPAGCLVPLNPPG